MERDNVKTPADALVYQTCCLLDMISTMAQKKRKPPMFDWHVNVVRLSLDWMKQFGVEDTGGRVSEVMAYASVDEWISKQSRQGWGEPGWADDRARCSVCDSVVRDGATMCPGCADESEEEKED